MVKLMIYNICVARRFWGGCERSGGGGSKSFDVHGIKSIPDFAIAQPRLLGQRFRILVYITFDC